ncbi:FecR family protein, partial [Chitinophaga sp.]|uniref:FecR family protein n=1 Tax=Chitinophaga sp. TaxID=1869181 RepID=UPI002FDEA7B7
MPIPQEKIVDLILQHLAGTLTNAGRTELEAWMNASGENREMASEFLDEQRVKAELQHLFEVKDRVWGKLDEHSAGKVVKMSGFRRKWLYAASVALIVTSAAAFWLYQRPPAAPIPVATTQEQNADVPTPAHTNAFITLGNGKKVYIDSVQTGNNLLPNSPLGQKTGDDRIAYTGENGKRPELHQITVPEGSKPLQVVLPDGSRLWLNVASSASFHVPFESKERAVAITGEGYFEVAHESARPFTVKSRGQVIKVLGTAFNVNAYENESAIKTTLVKGNIQLSQTKSGETLVSVI